MIELKSQTGGRDRDNVWCKQPRRPNGSQVFVAWSVGG